jgi:hypothetical protein
MDHLGWLGFLLKVDFIAATNVKTTYYGYYVSFAWPSLLQC